MYSTRKIKDGGLMFLYLVQHAEPKKEEEDPARPLSEKGAEEARRVAASLSSLNLLIGTILHSKKLRAKQTAEIMDGHLNPRPGISETDGLAPLDAPAVWDDRLKYMTEDVMLVGHLPHLDKLSFLLLCGDEDKGILSFTMGGVVCMERDEKGKWSLRWIITPATAGCCSPPVEEKD
jgi:phosphohistidine phosphatase